MSHGAIAGHGKLALWFLAAFVALAQPASAQFDRGFVPLRIDGVEVKWPAAAVGSPLILKWSLASGRRETVKARNCGRIDTPVLGSAVSLQQFRAEAEAAFALWSELAVVRFQYVADAGQANIVIGAQVDPRDIAYTNIESNGSGHITSALICLNPSAAWKIGFDGNLKSHDLRYVLAHEIGHAIGLDHPGASGQLMSFRYLERFRSPQRGDIDGLVSLYGAPRRASSETATR